MNSSDPLFFVVSFIILIMSIVMHELSHGYTAELLGDPTPRLQGRLTLNPLRHIDPFGSIILPILTSLMTQGAFIFGWAKPIIWNPYNVKNRRVGELLISIAGPGANILLAVVFGLVIRFGFGSVSFLTIASYIVLVNITLAIFNLVPVPPLDGSKVLFALIPSKYAHVRSAIEKNSFILIVILLFVLWSIIEPVIPWLFGLLTGMSL